MLRSVVFTTAMIQKSMVDRSLVVASYDEMLYDNYSCLVESNKQQIKKSEAKLNRKTWKPSQEHLRRFLVTVEQKIKKQQQQHFNKIDNSTVQKKNQIFVILAILRRSV